MASDQNQTPEMPTDPWTGRPYDQAGVTRIVGQLHAAHVVLDKYDRIGGTPEDTIWKLKAALGRIAKA